MEPTREDPELLKTATLTGRARTLPAGPLPPGPERELRLAPDRTFGGYRLVRSLGSGGFAEVWEAERLLDGRRVALKVLHASRDMSEDAQRRFEREGRVAGSLSHPRTVYVFGAEVIEGHPAIAMEIVHGGSLQDWLRKEGPLRPAHAVDAILDVIDGLEAAQRLGIVHRDIKPSNCFVDDVGRVKVGDFGISRSLDSDMALTAAGVFVGTPAYASPEQLKGEPLDHRSDLYSVGATLYVLLSGRPPFDARGAAELLVRVVTEPPVPFSKRGVRVARALQAIVLRLLSKDPSRRYASYDALRSALLPFSSREAVAADPVRRFGAYLVDVLLWNAVAFAALSGFFGGNALEWIQGPTTATPMVTAGLFVFRVLAFAFLEWVWQRTPGKHLFRLTIRSLGGTQVSPAQALLRNLSFWTLHDALSWGAAWAPSWLPLLSLAGAAVPCLSMRKGNGYAGLHELLSRTAVRTILDASRKIGAPASAGAPVAAPVAARDSAAEYRGPYRVARNIWRSEDASLTLASDDLLHRQVWIHEASRPSKVGARPDASHRAARLRWLQGGTHEARFWDAYEVPSGGSLAELVRVKGRLEWSEARGILLQLLREVAAGLAADDLPERMTTAHLWVDAFGHLKLLEFPAEVRAASGPEPEASPIRSWSDLLRNTVLLVLEGSEPVSAAPGPGPRTLRVPLSEGARLVIGRLFAGPLNPSRLQGLINDLNELCARPASVSRLVRSTHLLFAWGVPAVAAIGAFLGALESLHRRSTPAGGVGDVIMTVAGGVDSALVTLGIVSVFALVLAFAFRGGPVLRCFGTIVQERDGAPASRGRCLLRGTIALLPPLLVSAPIWLVVFLVLSGAGPRPETPPPGLSAINDWVWRIGSALAVQARTLPQGLRNAAVLSGSIPALVFLAGLVAAVLRPDRGIHDRIAGTRLVPR